LAAIVFLMTTAAPALADFNKKDWKYFRQIVDKGINDSSSGKSEKDNAVKDGRYIMLRLDELVYNGCSDNFADLRIINGSGNEVPYKLIESTGEQSASELKAKLFNMSESAGETTFVVDTGEQSWLHNRISIDTSIEGFVAKVKIEGSADEQKWNMLLENGLVYELSSSGTSVSNLEITYPDADYRFLLVTITNNDNVRVPVDSVRIERVKETPSREREIIKTGIVLNKNKRKSFAVIDLKHRQPSNRIELGVAGTNFYRQVVIYGSNDSNKKDWEELGADVIYKFETPPQSSATSHKSSKMSIKYSPGGFYRYLKLEIIDGDDQPLEADSVRVFDYERQLFYKAGRQPLSLYYGNPKALNPSYDIERVYPYVKNASTSRAGLAPEKDNNMYMMPEKPWSEQNPAVLWLVLIATGGIIAFFCFRLIRQIESDKK
jgi:hypothetical protein